MSFTTFSLDLTKLNYKFEPNQTYSLRFDADNIIDIYQTTNLDIDFYTFTSQAIEITGQVTDYKANVLNIQLSFSRNVFYNSGVVRLYHEDSSLIQTWDSTVLSTVDGTDNLVLSIDDPLNSLDRFTNYYVELEDDNFISEDRVLTKTNSWTSNAVSFSFNTGDHDILPFAALVGGSATLTGTLTYNVGNFTSNQSLVTEQNAVIGYLRNNFSVNMSSNSTFTCFLSPANALPHFLYYDHLYDITNDWIVFDAANTSAQNIDVLDHITGFTGYIYTLTVTPSNTSFVNTISSTSTLGSASFNNTSKVFTIVGNEAEISDNLDKLKITLTGIQGNFDLVYFISNNTNETTETKTIKIRNVNYPAFNEFEFFGGIIDSSLRNTPRSKTNLYSQYNSTTYPWINDSWFLEVDTGIYLWRVTESGMYTIWSKGGGQNSALMKSNFYLLKDEEIEILVGLPGSVALNANAYGTPGAGGTFVVKKKTVFGDWGIREQIQPSVSDILVIAGGAGSGSTSAEQASTSEIPNAGYLSQPFYGTTSISSGTISYSRSLDGTTYFGNAEGGAGFISDSGTTDSYINGGLGGLLNYSSANSAGGFGGGGASIGKLKTTSTTKYSGGGGGYAGGGAAIYIGNVVSPAYADGGGGSSYSNAYNIGGNTDLRWSPYPLFEEQYPHPFKISNVDVNGDGGFVAIIKE